ncbi:hypothetical protein OH77DRAFT_1420620 [Trametes cingulata]|nr:hypothetical protein OH77DRAFT_1420620 [Trametes cingulata]
MTFTIPLKASTFNLDISGVAGFFAGDVTASAMVTIHTHQGRRRLGWYNSPGSYEIAKRYGQLARSRFWDGLYPGTHVDPTILLGFDGVKGPRYRAAHADASVFRTGHLAHLFMQECRDIPWTEIRRIDGPRIIRRTYATIVDLHHQPEPEERPHLLQDSTSPLASIPIIASLSTCIACLVYEDWYCFSMILLGIVSSGVSYFVIGAATFTFNHPRHAYGAGRGDGVMAFEVDDEVVVLRGREGAVTPITRGRFSLRFASEPDYHDIGGCSLLLTVQFLLQLLLVPQGELFGQIMFLCSLVASWAYNCYLSSRDREGFQRRILDQILQKPAKRKYEFGTATIRAVFVLLVLAPAEPAALRKVLDDLLPGETLTWIIWKGVVIEKVCTADRAPYTLPLFSYAPDRHSQEVDGSTLATLFTDAEAAAEAYYSWK